MTTRTSSKHITFRLPFVLRGLDVAQPAGTYTVDTDEELIQALSFPAWRRTATTLKLVRGGITEYVPIDPKDLDEALARDA
jgi:hypothetical protein